MGRPLDANRPFGSAGGRAGVLTTRNYYRRLATGNGTGTGAEKADEKEV